MTPWTAARQASLSVTNSRSLLKPMSIESVMPSSHLILCRPLLLLPPIPPSIRVFSSESALCMRWPKYWSFSVSISPSNELPGPISFRMDWLANRHLQLRVKIEHLIFPWLSLTWIIVIASYPVLPSLTLLQPLLICVYICIYSEKRAVGTAVVQEEMEQQLGWVLEQTREKREGYWVEER